MISIILYRGTLQKLLSRFIQTKDLTMSADIIMDGAFSLSRQQLYYPLPSRDTPHKGLYQVLVI